jgi:3-hydroxyacyl-CoA dehydrogenase/enoyl-CoA hydratase/3-hydroxybutyryl-CoA epimerase
MADAAAGRSGPFLEIDAERIARITLDDPHRRHNYLTETVMTGLAGLVAQVRDEAETGKVRGLVFYSAKKHSFIAGADVDAIGAVEDPLSGEEAARFGQAIFGEVESLPVPTVAAIDGLCLGGGTELSLACRYRLASDSDRTKIGLPEVQLGILPAWGGTTRLPRLVGLQASLDMMLTGRAVSAAKARRIGLVDAVYPRELFRERVEAFLRDRVEAGPVRTGARRKFFRRVLEDTAPGRRVILRAARKQVMSRTQGHYPAPLTILSVVRRSLGRSVEAALRIEAAAAGELLSSGVSKNLVHVFHLREGAKKLPEDVEGQAADVARLGVLGAGVMGGGIAQLAAYHGVDVRMKDIRHDAVAAGLREASARFREAVERRKLDWREADQRLELISGGLSYHGFASADLVIEAVVERMDVKRSVLQELEAEVGQDCVLATNTSSLSVDEMAAVLNRPERFCGMHFFNPVHRMPLVEVVRGEATGDDAVATVHAFSRSLGKVPVVVRDGPGFLVNRILGPYLNEAGWLLTDGAAGPDVDRAAKSFGMPMGPLRLVDEVGIDIAGHAGATLYEAFGERMAPSPGLQAIGESGRLGRKGDLGFYKYEGGKEQSFDDGVYAALAPAVPASRVAMNDRVIRARLVLAMVNEAARVLEDGIARSAGDVDLAMIMGTGFPPFRGGLLRYADHLHPKTILDRLRKHEDSLGPRFAPAEVIVDMARTGRGFYDAFPP